MIASDQPRIFAGLPLRVALSSVDDGSMKDGTELVTVTATANRQRFLENLGFPIEKTAVFVATFDGEDYCRYQLAQPGIAIGVDAVATSEIGQPILLSLADCTGAVLYDTEHRALMVSHLGRHSTEQFGGEKSVAYMQKTFKSDPSKLLVWLSPSPNGIDYPLFAFQNRSFSDVLIEQLQSAGVMRDSIEVSRSDTVKNPDYFSHSEYLKGRQAIDGRYAIAAMLA